MRYATDIQEAHLAIVRDALAGGALEIGTAGMAAVLCRVGLASPAGEIAGGVLVLTPPTYSRMCDVRGDARSARLVAADGRVVADGLSVGSRNDLDYDLDSPPDLELSSTRLDIGIGVLVTSLRLRHG